jgi:hypothetical protein
MTDLPAFAALPEMRSGKADFSSPGQCAKCAKSNKRAERG